MIAELREELQTKQIDHSRRPVIGVLTEPLRGDLFKANDLINEQRSHTDDY